MLRWVQWKQWSVTEMMFKVQNEYFCNIVDHCHEKAISISIVVLIVTEVGYLSRFYYVDFSESGITFHLSVSTSTISVPLSDLSLTHFLCSVSLNSLYQSSLVCQHFYTKKHKNIYTNQNQ